MEEYIEDNKTKFDEMHSHLIEAYKDKYRNVDEIYGDIIFNKTEKIFPPDHEELFMEELYMRTAIAKLGKVVGDMDQDADYIPSEDDTNNAVRLYRNEPRGGVSIVPLHTKDGNRNDVERDRAMPILPEIARNEINNNKEYRGKYLKNQYGIIIGTLLYIFGEYPKYSIGIIILLLLIITAVILYFYFKKKNKKKNLT